ncbi:DUF523 domain-containing protein [Caldanaerobius polysaccharolyticus]|uniref:DUF523 domain-containing protein n=1 Tax=Caldanaerobius polysaccharolyticus TaxID=44256 RepID=UPI00047C93DA|nr:DUF523 domain-containing protein [Caldanaerobius polysaccharolyticus]
MLIVSACLAGLNTRYDGKGCIDEKVYKLIKEGKAIPVCPEQLGGLSTPRCPSEICGGTGCDVLDRRARVITSDGRDVTENFVRGAYEVLKLAKAVRAKKAVLKAKSPSCGWGSVYDGTFTGNLIRGNGVTAELLMREGIDIESRG